MPPKPLRPAAISLSVSLVDLVTPAGRGKRVSFVAADHRGEQKKTFHVITKRRPTRPPLK